MNDILNKEPMEEDYGIEKSLRPQFFNQYIGQDKVKEQLDAVEGNSFHKVSERVWSHTKT